MGQPITVTVRAGASPDVRFFECDRSLTGMAIEVYTADSEAAVSGARPPDVLARRLLEAGASKVTIYSNVVTVEAPVLRYLRERPARGRPAGPRTPHRAFLHIWDLFRHRYAACGLLHKV